MSTDEDISELTSDSDESDIAEPASESENAGSDSEPEGMYGNEPEYTAAELLLLSDEANISTDSEGRGSDLNSSRLENMHWCTCAECSIMPTLPESKCCQEFKVLLEGKLSDEVTCITKHAHFADICLKKHIDSKNITAVIPKLHHNTVVSGTYWHVTFLSMDGQLID